MAYRMLSQIGHLCPQSCSYLKITKSLEVIWLKSQILVSGEVNFKALASVIPFGALLRAIKTICTCWNENSPALVSKALLVKHSCLKFNSMCKDQTRQIDRWQTDRGIICMDWMLAMYQHLPERKHQNEAVMVWIWNVSTAHVLKALGVLET
jgi:hypothetical protein